MSARPRLDGVLRAPVTRDEARIAVRRARARGTTVAAVLRAAAVEAGLLDDDHKPKLCPCCDQSANPSDAGR